MNGYDIGAAHPRISRETRRLLSAVLLALVSLLVLTRVRFSERPQSDGPIPPLLAQLSPLPPLEALAQELGKLRQRVAPSLVVLPGTMPDRPRVGLRFQTDTAITYLDPAERNGRMRGVDLLGLDRTTGLAIVRLPRADSAPLAPRWSPDSIDGPRYLAVVDALHDSVSMRPVFVGAFRAVSSPGWSAPLWQIPSSAELASGSLLFTGDGEFAGMLIRDANTSTIVPADTLIADAERVLRQFGVPASDLGISTRPLTNALSTASGTKQGVVVAYVNAAGPAARRLAPGDVIERINGELVRTPHEWESRVAGVAPEEKVDLLVWRAGARRGISVAAAAIETASSTGELGLTLRWIPAFGSEVVHVAQASAAEAAGLLSGDVITSAGATALPTPSHLRTAFARVARGRSLVLGYTRAGTPDVLALVKP